MLRPQLAVSLFCVLTASLPTYAEDELPIRFAWFVDFSPDGKSLVAPYGGWLANEGGEVRVWDVQTGKAKYVIASPRGVRGAAWSPKETFFASGSYGGAVVLYDSKTGEKKLELSTGGDNAQLVQITPNGQQVIATTGSGMIWIWETATGDVTDSMRAHSDSIWGTRLAPDGKTLATAGKDKTVCVTNIESGMELFKLVHPNIPLGVAFTSDVGQLVTGCRDSQIRIWDLETGELTRTLNGHRGSVNDFDLSPNGKLLASSSSDNTVRLWEFDSGKLLATLEGHKETVYGVRFSPNGKILASGSWDATIKIWDVEKRKEVMTLAREPR